MTNFISDNNARVQNFSFSSVLMQVKYENATNDTQGRIFQDKNFAHDWESVDVYPTVLDIDNVKNGMRKITEPVLAMMSHSPKMAFVLASETEPVFFDYNKRGAAGYVLLFKLRPHILPEYVFYMSKYDSWIGISKELDMAAHYGNFGWNMVGFGGVDEFGEWWTTAEDVFLQMAGRITIPSISMQSRIIDEAKLMETRLQDKFAEKERKYQQKEWLNEAHIRNSKHRLSNEVMPIRMAVERLQNFFLKNDNGVKASDKIGEKSGSTVYDLLKGLHASVIRMEEEINNLTKSEQAGEPEQEFDVAEFLNRYCDNIMSTYSKLFAVKKIGFDYKIRIKMSPKALIELLDNVVNNAVRHGFTEGRNDYVLQFEIEQTGNGMCRINIANNGTPMSERARTTYFEPGSFAGETGNSGFGGFRIYDICDKAGGQALTPYRKEGFPVVISVEFPYV